MTAAEARNRALLAWYDRHRRALPWRDTTDPWAILVSEVMLQQTQVSRVAEAYPRFLERFPTPEALAAASVAELIDAWGNLGYQRRALNLQRAAFQIVAHGWPRDREGLERLPGVGAYTATAVACFAYGESVAAVDTNLRRVLSRWEGEALTSRALASAAEATLDRRRPADWNQAMMDLGASLCRPRRPRCERCPVSDWCTDPGVEVPTPRQARFEGSVRQARAAVLKYLAAAGPTPAEDLAEATALDPDRIRRAVRDLSSEGTVVELGGRIALSDAPAGSRDAAPPSSGGLTS